MYAVIRTGGKQHRVAEGDVIVVESLPGEVGGEVVLDQVLAVADDGDLLVDRKALSGTVVKAVILEQLKGDKVVAFKFKKRKGYARTKGHRQHLTRLEIEAIDVPGRPKKAKAAKVTPKVAPAVKEKPAKAAAKKSAVKAAAKAADKHAEEKTASKVPVKKAAGRPAPERKAPGGKPTAAEKKAATAKKPAEKKAAPAKAKPATEKKAPVAKTAAAKTAKPKTAKPKTAKTKTAKPKTAGSGGEDAAKA